MFPFYTPWNVLNKSNPETPKMISTQELLALFCFCSFINLEGWETKSISIKFSLAAKVPPHPLYVFSSNFFHFLIIDIRQYCASRPFLKLHWRFGKIFSKCFDGGFKETPFVNFSCIWQDAYRSVIWDPFSYTDVKKFSELSKFSDVGKMQISAIMIFTWVSDIGKMKTSIMLWKLWYCWIIIFLRGCRGVKICFRFTGILFCNMVKKRTELLLIFCCQYIGMIAIFWLFLKWDPWHF